MESAAGPLIPTWGWYLFGVLVLVLLAVDHLAHRKEHENPRRTAGIWTAIWISAGMLFCIFVWWQFGGVAGREYLATYLIEESLSLDNLFVFLIIFQSLGIPKKYQHEVLFWGIFGAVVFRGIFIFAGAAALEQYHWLAYVFGGLLLYAAWSTLRNDPAEESENRAVQWLSQHLPLTHRLHEGRFIARENGRRVVTPLLIALVAIELTDIVFAIDSVAAALSMTTHTFVLYSANVFAILGLRSIYLFLSHLIEDLKYLHYGLAAVLAFAGLKLIAGEHLFGGVSEGVKIFVSIGFIVVTISISVWASLRHRKHHPEEPPRPGAEKPEISREEVISER